MKAAVRARTHSAPATGLAGHMGKERGGLIFWNVDMTNTSRRQQSNQQRSSQSFTPDEFKRGASEIFLTEDELAERWKHQPKTLRNLRSAGQGPPYHKFRSSVRYALSDILQYEAQAKRPAGH